MTNWSLTNWMSTLPDSIKTKPLVKIAIPGSHNTFTYTITEKSDFSPDNDVFLKKFKFLKGKFRPWCQTQNCDVYSQLTHGTRYLDLRIAKNDGVLYFVHGMYGGEVKPGLELIRNFLNEYTTEVVMLDFQHFFEMEQQDHVNLAKMINGIFSNILCPRPKNPIDITIADLQSQKLQAIVIYRNNFARKPFWFSKDWDNPWPNYASISKLIGFLDTTLKARTGNRGYVSQCVLTPTANTIMGHLVKGSVKDTLAKPALPEIMKWLDTANLSNVNVVLGDFVDLNDYQFTKKIVSLNYAS